jgi:hypothetical protein
MINSYIELAHEDDLINKVTFSKTFSKKDISQDSWRDLYNNWINNLPNSRGVYIFSYNSNVIYIGSSGKVSNKSKKSNWKLPQRLKASRGKNDSNKDVSTVDFLREIICWGKSSVAKYNHLPKIDIDELTITVLITKDNIPPTYLESLFLFKFYSANNKLPLLNIVF